MDDAAVGSIAGSTRTLHIPPIGLPADLAVPPNAAGIVIFAHGSGSSRLSPRNRLVADQLRRAGFGTLLFDLLLESEAMERANVFHIALLARRLALASRWLAVQPEAAGQPIGYFGASTGAAAALVAAADAGDRAAAIVSRGGRPDLAGSSLSRVRAPTLLIVGGRDVDVLALNRLAYGELVCPKDLAIVPDATHLFEEPGALDDVIGLARTWFLKHLKPPAG
jgi:putative phosphoribosyl transferase